MPTQFRDASGQERLLGTIYVPGATVGDVFTVQVNGSLSPAPGGGSQPVQAVYSGNAVTIADQASVNLTFDSLNSGTPLLDLTDPALPIFLAPGTYAITLNWSMAGTFTALGWALGQLYVAENSLVGNSPIMSGPASGGGTSFTLTAIAVVTDIAQPLLFNVSNVDGAASQDFRIAGTTIVKLAG